MISIEATILLALLASSSTGLLWQFHRLQRACRGFRAEIACFQRDVRSGFAGDTSAVLPASVPQGTGSEAVPVALQE